MTSSHSSNPNNEANSTDYTVVQGDYLIKIVRDRAKNLGINVSDSEVDALVDEICELNDISDKNLIYPGDRLRLPSDLQSGNYSSVEGSIPEVRIGGRSQVVNSDKEPIHIGSIIHLKNGLQDGGGYLNLNGWAADREVFTNWHDPRVRALVCTHSSNNLTQGSGSWQILSAEGKENGEELKVGDKIHLRNMHIGAGYLDTFEWAMFLRPFLTEHLTENAKKLIPFRDYRNRGTMPIGVFTSSVPKRSGGLEATWTIESAENKRSGEPLVEDDDIYLREDHFRFNSLLHTYSGKVTNHAEFQGAEGHVLINPPFTDDDEAYTWNITLNKLPPYLYRVHYRRGDRHAPWHSAGLFKIGDPEMNPLKSLSLASSDGGETLSITVDYERGINSESSNFIANHLGQNFYGIAALPGVGTEESIAAVQWCFGARESQKVVQMDVTFDDDGRSFAGTMTYQGEVSINVTGTQTDTGLNATTRLLNDYFQTDALRQRTKKIEGVIDATYKLIAATFGEVSQEIFNDVVADRKSKPVQTQKQNPPIPEHLIEPIDYHFQRNQLLNLYGLSEILNSFFRNKLQELMRQSLDHHQLAQTLPPLHLIRECFQRFATDHEIIQQATVQRRWIKSPADDSYFMSENGVQLLVMDKLAIKAIRPFQHLLRDHPKELAIVSYLSERTHIHRVPYTNQCILLGVSYDRLPPAPSFFDDEEFDEQHFYGFELMAIPHEVAHFIYQYGTLKDGRTFPELSEQFAGNPYYRWCEEIFADVYGCIISGPLTVLSLQALLVSIDGDRAWNDDEEHPTPVVRLFILSEILRVLHEKGSPKTNYETDKKKRDSVEKLTKKLDTKWRKILEAWGYDQIVEYEHEEWNRGRKRPTFLKDQGRPERVYMHDQSAQHLETIINVDRLVNAVRPIIVEFVKHLLEAHEDGGKPQKDGELSLAIPWSDSYQEALSAHYNVMDRLANRDFAAEQIASQRLLVPSDDAEKTERFNPDKNLQQYLDKWEDKGPIPHGGSGGTRGFYFSRFSSHGFSSSAFS